jgi:hypothetical protein
MNASFQGFDLPPLDRPRSKGLGEIGLRLGRLAKATSSLARRAGRWAADAVTSLVGNDMPAGGDFSAYYEEDEVPELARLAGDTQWGRATARLVTGNRQANDAHRFHFSATDQLDAAAYEMRMLMKELTPVVEAALPVPPTAEVLSIAEPLREPAPAAATAPLAKPEKRAKPRKKSSAAA